MEVKFKKFCNRHIMLELPTIKTDFLFKNSQDFNQTTHARPQHPIVFIHNISLYFNCISSMKYLFKWCTCHGHILPFSVISLVQPKWVEGKLPTCILECRLFCSFHFFTFKMVVYEADSECSNE